MMFMRREHLFGLIVLALFASCVVCVYVTSPKKVLDRGGMLRALRLGENLRTLANKGAVFLVDGDNVRGKTSFAVSKEQLLLDLEYFQSKYNASKQVVLHYDHGMEHEAYMTKNNLSVVFSGAKTADDIITRDVSWLQKRFKLPVVVVTADSGLKARCHQSSKGNTDLLTIVDSTMFAELLGVVETERLEAEVTKKYEEEAAARRTIAQAAVENSIDKQVDVDGDDGDSDDDDDDDYEEEEEEDEEDEQEKMQDVSLLERTERARRELRLRNQIRSIEKISSMKSCGRKKLAKMKKRLTEVEGKLRNLIVMGGGAGAVLENGGGGEGGDTLVTSLLRMGSGQGREETWERCIHAERLRGKLLSEQVRLFKEQQEANLSPSTTQDNALLAPVDIYVAELNANYSQRNISKMLLEGQEELANLTYTNIGVPAVSADLASSPPFGTDASSNSQLGSLVAGSRLARALIFPPPLSQGQTQDGVGFVVAADGSREYRRDAIFLTKTSSASSSAPPPIAASPTSLRIVCVSDTHGMERALSGHVPPGDFLIHAGDYSGDRGKSTLKTKALDEWLAQQPHKIKIVVRGNHDSFSASFPLSGAIYASKATAFALPFANKWLRIGLAPYGTLKVPDECDIIISHEPPRDIGMLDQTLKADRRAGSEALTISANKLAHKPQLWVCGHIHEGYGACDHAFRELDVHSAKGKAKKSIVARKTLLVNAANANGGPAHSLVNLPSVIVFNQILEEVADSPLPLEEENT